MDSSGRPTVEADVFTDGGYLGRAAASTGTSVGKSESSVLRDGDLDMFEGMSVYKAIENIESILAPALMGMDVMEQEKIDRVMIELDGTRYKSNLGGNAVYALSVAVLRAAAAVKGQPLCLAMAEQPLRHISVPASNIVNGGTYSDRTLAFQEFMVIPYDVKDMYEATRVIVEVFLRLGKIIKKTSGKAPDVGSYSGHGIPSDDPFEVFDMIAQAVSELGYSQNVCYAIDCAASGFYDESEGAYLYRGALVSRDEIIKELVRLAEKYPIAFIEDALQEDDFEGFKKLSEQADALIVGDDLLCTSLDRIEKAVMMGAVGGMVFKPNQAGTITEALEAAEYMTERGMLVMPSNRAGGAIDPTEKEIGLAKGMYMAKIGAPRSGPRTANFNFLCRLGEELSLPVANVREMPFLSRLKPKLKQRG